MVNTDGVGEERKVVEGDIAAEGNTDSDNASEGHRFPFEETTSGEGDTTDEADDEVDDCEGGWEVETSCIEDETFVDEDDTDRADNVEDETHDHTK